MTKLKMHSPDSTQINIGVLKELFPHCVTEAVDATGHVCRVIDFDQLRQELAGHIVDGPRERYQIAWPGKREALLAANAPIAKTLRPCRAESVQFDSTRNLLIEGDNLDALKLLQETYLNRVRLIYIDPPYNTGHDFVYDDDFRETTDEYLVRSNQADELHRHLMANTESNGRYHSDWLTMIYPRLKLARTLLAPDGAIFISIDETELAGLKLLCDEIFGFENFLGLVSRATGTRMGSGSRGLARELDYLLVYSKVPDSEFRGLPMTEGELAIYDQEDERGRYLTRSLRRTGGENRREDRPSMYYPVQAPDGTDVYPIAPAGYESRWVCGKETYKRLLVDGYIEWKKIEKDGRPVWQVYQKHYLNDALKHPSNLWAEEEGNKKATRDLNELFDERKVFDHPKPLGLLRKIITLAAGSHDESVILDFFGGSGTTAHAVMAQNAADGGNRRFILVQMPEPLSSNNRSQQVAAEMCRELGLAANVAELAKERLRRAGEGLSKGLGLSGGQFDNGFRVLKVDSSNMKDVYYQPDAITQKTLTGIVDNIRDDRTDEDLLLQVLLDWGVDLTLPINRETVGGKLTFFVDSDALAACFEDGISEPYIKELAKRKPLRVVFRDAGYGSDAAKINVEQIFKLLSSTTEVKSI